MDNNQESTNPALREDVEPPREARLTTMLNGMGNGSMLAGAPVAAYQLYHKLQHGKDPSKKGLMLLAFATIAGAGVGAWFGGHEADRMHAYRQKLSDEVNALRRDTAHNSAAIGQWTHKHEAEKAEAHHAHTPVVG